MKSTYIQTKWIDNKTPVNAANLNKIEQAIGDLYSNAISYRQLKEGRGVKVQSTENKDIEISVSDDVMTSDYGLRGVETIFNCNCGCMEQEIGKLYFVLDSETKKLLYISLNGVKIFEVDNNKDEVE